MTPPIWAAAFAVFGVLMAADLALTRNAVGLRTAAMSSALVHLPVWMSLAAIVAVVAGAVAASLWRDRSRPREPLKTQEPHGPVRA
jgi:hypothetical protein